MHSYKFSNAATSAYHVTSGHCVIELLLIQQIFAARFRGGGEKFLNFTSQTDVDQNASYFRDDAVSALATCEESDTLLRFETTTHQRRLRTAVVKKIEAKFSTFVPPSL